MSNLPLQPLVWTQKNLNPLAELELTAYSALHEYIITEPVQGMFELKKTRLGKPDKKSEILENFQSFAHARNWVWSHYQRSMQPYVKPDSITDIANWFKAAKPEPTIEDLCVQIGCCLEEVAELIEGLGVINQLATDDLPHLANGFKNKDSRCLELIKGMSRKQRIDIVDACCDINVTSVGVMQLLGSVDVLGAQCEVIRSNNSKMVNGRFEFDANGKIAKPDSYSEPDLTPFIKESDCDYQER